MKIIKNNKDNQVKFNSIKKGQLFLIDNCKLVYMAIREFINSNNNSYINVIDMQTDTTFFKQDDNVTPLYDTELHIN